EPDSAATCVARAAAELGGLDVLVNNAGVTLKRPFLETSPADVERVVAINFMAAWNATREAVPHMRQREGGVVVNISSIHSLLGMSGHSIYAATKGALNALTRELAVELAPDRIRVNAVAPGLIEVERY